MNIMNKKENFKAPSSQEFNMAGQRGIFGYRLIRAKTQLSNPRETNGII